MDPLSMASLFGGNAATAVEKARLQQVSLPPMWFLKPEGLTKFYRTPIGGSVDQLSKTLGGGDLKAAADAQAARQGGIGPVDYAGADENIPPAKREEKKAQEGFQIPPGDIWTKINSSSVMREPGVPQTAARASMARSKALMSDATARAETTADLQGAQVEDVRSRHGVEVAAERGHAKAQRQELEAERQKYRGEYEQLAKNAAKGIDPDRWMRNRTESQQLSLAVARAIGAFVQGFTRGQVVNGAEKMIDRHIRRDIEAQKIELSQAREAKRDKLNLLGLVQSQVGETYKAEQATYALLSMKLENDIKGISAHYAGDKTRVEMDKLAAQMEMRRAGTQVAIAKAEAGRKVSTYTSRKSVDSPALSAIKKMAAMAKQQTAAAKQRKYDRPPPKAIEKHGEFMGAMTSLDRATQLVAQKWSGVSSEFWKRIPGTDEKRIKDLYLRILAVEKRKSGESGVMTERDFQRYKNIFEPAFASKRELLQRLRMVKADMMRRYRQSMHAWGAYYDTSPMEQQFRELSMRQHLGSISTSAK